MINASREERKWESAFFFFEKYTFALKSAVFFSYISYKGLFTYKSVI
jgi:hypothetical protein